MEPAQSWRCKAVSAWHKEPPTYQEWRAANNHGYWWVKFILIPEKIEYDEDNNPSRWPEVWYTDVVSISVSYGEGNLLNPSAAHLHAQGQLVGHLDLDDKEQIKDMYWQPVVPPSDDTPAARSWFDGKD